MDENQAKLPSSTPSTSKEEVKSLSSTPSSTKEDETSLSAIRVSFLGLVLLIVGTIGFYALPGMMKETVSSSSELVVWLNAFYCSTMTLTTVGFGDICPTGEINLAGKIFLVLFSLSGLGMFCGPVMELASKWKHGILSEGGYLSLAVITLGVGVFVFSVVEGLSLTDALYASVITGTTIGYGDFAPSTSLGKIAVAVYAIAAVPVVATLLEPARKFLETLCRSPSSTHKPKTE